MNELYLWKGTQIYFKTNAKTIRDAFDEARKACESVGIEIYADHAELRDEEYNNIDEGEVW